MGNIGIQFRVQKVFQNGVFFGGPGPVLERVNRGVIQAGLGSEASRLPCRYMGGGRPFSSALSAQLPDASGRPPKNRQRRLARWDGRKTSCWGPHNSASSKDTAGHSFE